MFLRFLPAISGKAAKAIRQTVRGWNLQRRTPISLAEIARRINPVLRGWMAYYGRFYKSALYSVMAQIDLHLAKWIARKHKRVRRSLTRAFEWLRQIRRDYPSLFLHWQLAYES